MRISDWSSDVYSSDLPTATPEPRRGERTAAGAIRRPFSCYCPLRLCAGSLGSVRSRSGVLGGLGAVGALCGGTFGRDEIVRRVDDSDVREGQREGPKMAAGTRVVLLGQEAQTAAQDQTEAQNA